MPDSARQEGSATTYGQINSEGLQRVRADQPVSAGPASPPPPMGGANNANAPENTTRPEDASKQPAGHPARKPGTQP